jgi:predicted small lipoprotein YifL
MDPLSFPTLKQLSVSNKPSCRLYSSYKKIIDFTSFLPENTSFKIRYWYFQNQVTSPVLCACGCKIPLKMPQISKYASGHSNAAPEVKEKKKQNLQKKHGENITNVSQLKEVKEKKKQTTLKNYGVESPFCHKHMSKVWMEMWGVDNPSKLESVKKQLSEKHKIIQKEKREQKIATRLKNFYQKLVSHPLFEPVFSEEEYKGCRKFYPFKCRRCGTITEDNLSDGTHFRCYKCTPRVGSGAQSLIEKELEEFCQKLDSSVITQSRKIISPLELDMFFPNQKIAVELNGLYFHSEKMGKGRSYHLSKTQSCENLNILLLQIFEDEWKK